MFMDACYRGKKAYGYPIGKVKSDGISLVKCGEFTTSTDAYRTVTLRVVVTEMLIRGTGSSF
jgi:hypothetical protein